MANEKYILKINPHQLTPSHIYWFAHYNLSCPSVRYRGKFALDYLNSTGKISYSFVVPGYSLKIIFNFIRVYFTALIFCRKNSLIVIQKVHSDNIYANALKILVMLRKKNSVYDLDDAEYIRHNDRTLNFFLAKCAAVTVGSKVLLDYSKKFNTNVILNSSSIISHDFRKFTKNEKLTIGWVGDMGNGNIKSHPFSHKKSLFNLFFQSLRNMVIPMKLTLIGINRNADKDEIREYFSDCKNLEIDIPEKIDWQDNDWLYAKISEFDLGIAPLVDHEFNRAKSAFKIKQYLSCGVPVLASNVGENQRFIDHGNNGFLCDTPEDFRDKILEFSSMPQNRYAEFINNAYKTKDLFTMKMYCERIVHLNKSINFTL